MSYNEEQQKVGTIKRIFLPQATGLIYEMFVAGLLLFIMSLSFISKSFQATSPESNPVAYFTEISAQGWSLLNQYHLVQQIMVFMLWAIFGMAVYVLLFKSFQLIYGTIYQIHQGVEYVHKDHAGGLVRWLGSMHDILLKALVWIGGSFAMFFGIIVCLSYATLQLTVAANETLPANLLYYAIAYLGILLGVRLVVMGLCFLLPSFRRWYAV